jgi:hypothetical protein
LPARSRNTFSGLISLQVNQQILAAASSKQQETCNKNVQQETFMCWERMFLS